MELDGGIDNRKWDASSGTGGAGDGAGGTGDTGPGRAGASGIDGGADGTGGTGGTGGAGGIADGGSDGWMNRESGGASGIVDAAPVCARDEAGRIPAEAKACLRDSDCDFTPTYSCCGPSEIIGLAKNSAYHGCLQKTPPEGCGPLGCASFPSTEDQQQVPYATAQSLTGVVVHCVAVDGGARSCMTSYDAEAGRP